MHVSVISGIIKSWRNGGNMVNLILDLFPFWVSPSSPFCNLEVGDVFQERDGIYRLLYRDMSKVQVVKLNWWTKLWYGGEINGRILANGRKRT